ncbi:MAG: PorV/PorQ family protein [Candidatus Hatepunaea meridiana]|nr:PorV/PorQ family protein [Candidatus Hatepunaea meridiana]
MKTTSRFHDYRRQSRSFGMRHPAVLSTILIVMLLVTTRGHCLVGHYAGEVMAAGGGARSLAMGGACTALTDDAWSLFWNPSGLANVDRMQLGLMHSERFDGIVDYDVGVFAIPRPDKSVWSLGLIRLGVNGIPNTRLEDDDQPHSENNRVEVDHYFNDGQYAFFIAKAAQMKNWRWGIAPKFLYQHLDEHSAYGLGIDLGFAGRLFPRFPVITAITVRDMLGTVLTWDTDRSEVIPPTLKVGLASTINLSRMEAKLSPVVDFTYRFEAVGDSDAVVWQYGMEYLVKDMVALRVGSDEGRLTFGGGINLKVFAINYAFLDHDDLGDTHRISIIARWSKKQVEVE